MGNQKACCLLRVQVRYTSCKPSVQCKDGLKDCRVRKYQSVHFSGKFPCSDASIVFRYLF